MNQKMKDMDDNVKGIDVPTALSSLAKLRSETKLVNYTLDFPDHQFHVICPDWIKADLGDWLRKAIENEYRLGLKEGLRLETTDIVGWLKIEEDRVCDEPFMFFTDRETYDKTCELFGF